MITVKSGLPTNRVALWERHPDHPGGEVFIADEKEYQVAETAAVKARLKSGDLIEVKPDLPPEPAIKPQRRARRGHLDQ